MKNFLKGIQYFLAGFMLLRQPGIKRFVVIPLCINICLFIGLFFLTRHYMNELNVWFTHWLPAWLHFFAVILWALFFISFMLVFVYTFVTLANIVAAPFNSFLAEKVEFYLRGSTLESRTLLQNIRDIPRILARQFSILGYYLPRAVLLIILFLVPLLHIMVMMVWFLFNAWFIALTYIDYPTDNHRVPLDEVRLWLKKRRLVALGFGMSTLVVSMIPIINFFTIPAAVAGATKWWIEDTDC